MRVAASVAHIWSEIEEEHFGVGIEWSNDRIEVGTKSLELNYKNCNIITEWYYLLSTLSTYWAKFTVYLGPLRNVVCHTYQLYTSNPTEGTKHSERHVSNSKYLTESEEKVK